MLRVVVTVAEAEDALGGAEYWEYRHDATGTAAVRIDPRRGCVSLSMCLCVGLLYKWARAMRGSSPGV